MRIQTRFYTENRLRTCHLYVCALYISTILCQRSLKIPDVFNLLFVETATELGKADAISKGTGFGKLLGRLRE